ncbi:hypothetical protein ERN12_10625 [Rhodobacteraceae bacterium]|nr:hypothetical protein ERN12_10625 [Paracoccaceae bacterium]
MRKKTENKTRELIELLKKEKEFIVSSEINEVLNLSPRKEALIQEIKEYSNDEINLIKNFTEKNQNLLIESLKGIRSAQLRVNAIHKATQGFSSYNSDGKSKFISGTESGIKKRS